MRPIARATPSASRPRERDVPGEVVTVSALPRHRQVRPGQLRCLQGSRGTPGGRLGGGCGRASEVRVIDTLRLTAEEASGLLDRGEVSPAELHRAYLDAAALRNDELNAYLYTVEDGAERATAAPIAFKDVVST